VELKHLQALLGIADTGSFSAAAASIGTVQSNVSAHVARLERELDVQLVDRASGRLTEEGEVVMERARRVMNELDAMVADVTALREEVVGTVRLGMIGTTGRWLVPQLFDLLRVRHPHIHLNVGEGSSMQLEQQLASGQLDLAVVTFPLSGDEIMAAIRWVRRSRCPWSACPSWSSCCRPPAPLCGRRSTAPRCRPGSPCARRWSSTASA
jgi:DNA-binding transcriptional LysR family regulator